ncbi:MAG: ABC transporter substrate-binding protein [Firmicutes bacterium]|nr:ABC transporter substrate-binding protein [Bacillota bacterium]
MKTKKTVRFLALALAAVLLLGTLAGCGSKESGSKTQDTLRIAGEDIVTFNPFMAVNGPDIMFMMHIIGEPLLLCNDKFEYEPLLAESYDLSADGMTYTFHLRKGVTFHDGSDFDSEDVKYSIESAAAGNTAGELSYYITSIETPDAQTCVVNLNAPLSSFLLTLYTFVPMMPSGIFESGYDFEAHPVGTGPYEFVSYTPGDTLVLKKYDKYYVSGVPAIPNLQYRVISDASTAFVALETGDLDYYEIQPTDISLAEKNKDLNVNEYATYATVIAWMDNSVAPFDDLNFRLALNHAVNREALANVKGSHGYSPAATYVSPSCYGYNADIEVYKYDTALAKEYLSKSKYSPSEISFTITTADANKMEAQFLQEAFRDIGLENVTIETLEPSTFQSGIMTKEFPFGITPVGLGSSASAASIMFSTDAPINMMNYSNPDVDADYALAATTPSEAERLAAFHRIDENLHADAPFLPLLYSNNVLASRTSIDITKSLEYVAVTSEILPQYVKAAK